MSSTPVDASGPEGQTFWEHLAELRRRLVFVAVTLLAGFFVGWGFREELFALLTAPVREGLAVHGIHRLTAIEAAEAMVVYLKLSLAAAVVMTVPASLYQIWAFVRPGLLAVEIRPMRRVVVLAFFMFVLGVLFCYRLVLPLVMEFLAAFTLGSGGVEFQVTMNSAYSTALLLLVGFGLVFELPLVMVLLATTPLADWRKYLRWIRYAVVLSFVVGAVFTPPDVLSQFLMAVPLCLLYGVGIFLSYLMEKRRERGGEAARGVDWGLLGMGAVLAGLVALLVLPRPIPAVSFLPYGAESVSWTGSGRIPSCGGMEGAASSVPGDGAEWTCGRYAEGNLLVGSRSGGWADGICPVTEGQEAGEAANVGSGTSSLGGPLSPAGGSGRPGREGAGDVRGACVVDGDVVVMGQQLLVTRYVHNRKMRLVDSDPVLPPGAASESLWVSLRRTEGRQAPFVRISRSEEAPERMRVGLSFSDAQRAREFAAILEEGKDLSLPGRGTAAEHAGLHLAVVELAAAVDELASRVEEPTGVRSMKARLERVRMLLVEASDAAGEGRLSECGGPACAYALLSERLPEPDGVEAAGRLVTVWFRPEQVPASVPSFLDGAIGREAAP
ncbi:MAG: twin-arginine translocase subunit TatC [Deltaproteobacteria bacterium]|nr:twin-arginine translocase subunit TatC [Deltaproteobacteria bacterium]